MKKSKNLETRYKPLEYERQDVLKFDPSVPYLQAFAALDAAGMKAEQTGDLETLIMVSKMWFDFCEQLSEDRNEEPERPVGFQ